MRKMINELVAFPPLSLCPGLISRSHAKNNRRLWGFSCDNSKPFFVSSLKRLKKYCFELVIELRFDEVASFLELNYL